MDKYKTGSFHWEVAYIIPLSIQPDPPVDGVEWMITLQTLHIYRYYFQIHLCRTNAGFAAMVERMLGSNLE